MSYGHILFEADSDGIAVVTVNRPSKLNALSDGVIGDLEDAFARVAREPKLRGLIVTGSGDKAFVAGADIQELSEQSAVRLRKPHCAANECSAC